MSWIDLDNIALVYSEIKQVVAITRAPRPMTGKPENPSIIIPATMSRNPLAYILLFV
jgi:hypothetical protein